VYISNQNKTGPESSIVSIHLPKIRSRVDIDATIN
jgi:hypothetical protein